MCDICDILHLFPKLYNEATRRVKPTLKVIKGNSVYTYSLLRYMEDKT